MLKNTKSIEDFNIHRENLSKILKNLELKNKEKGMVATSIAGPITGAAIGAATGMIPTALAKLLKNITKESFYEYLNKLIDTKKFNSSDIIRESSIEKSYFYQIKKGRKNPSRDTIIKIAFSLKLNKTETENLLNKAGYGLSNQTPRDAIILYCIEKKLDLIRTEELILDCKEASLMNIN